MVHEKIGLKRVEWFRFKKKAKEIRDEEIAPLTLGIFFNMIANSNYVTTTVQVPITKMLAIQ